MNSTTLRLSVLSATLLAALPAWGVGFGDIVMHSRIGEPLRAEVPIQAAAGENLESSCFSLATLDGSDLPVVASARTRLVRNGNQYRLQITGSKPLSEPLFMIGLRAGCGIDLQRDYVVMPPEPLLLAAPAALGTGASPLAESRGRSAPAQEWRASEGDTLEGIAETLVPDNLVQQRRLLAALKRANPKLSGRPSLADGTPVVIPDIKQRIPAERDNLPEQQAKARPETPPPPPPPAPKPKPAPKAKPKAEAPKPVAAAAADTSDRVVLGAPPAELQPGEKAGPDKGQREVLSARLQKMEVTVQSLNAQIEALDKALALTAEALALQQKLQAAQAAQAATGTLPAPLAKPLEAPPPASSNWLEVLFSALAGGAIASAIAHFLGRRRSSTFAAPLPLASNEPPAAAPPAGVPGVAAVNPGSAAPATNRGNTPDKAAIEVLAADARGNPDDSAIALAEIMLTFGRPDAAVAALAKHIEENSPANPRPWLMLVDLYRRHGKLDQYNRLLPALRQKLNYRAPAWDDVEKHIPGMKTLEDYTHIARNLKSTWGTPACLEYLDKLIHDTRDGQRSGFPLYVLEEIMLLMRVLEDAYGLKAST